MMDHGLVSSTGHKDRKVKTWRNSGFIKKWRGHDLDSKTRRNEKLFLIYFFPLLLVDALSIISGVHRFYSHFPFLSYGITFTCLPQRIILLFHDNFHTKTPMNRDQSREFLGVSKLPKFTFLPFLETSQNSQSMPWSFYCNFSITAFCTCLTSGSIFRFFCSSFSWS